MSGSTPRLESSIRDFLSPVLESDGFFGSGRTFRRMSGDLIQVVQVQGSPYGGKFAVNLGIQPASIPDVAGEERSMVGPCRLKRKHGRGCSGRGIGLRDNWSNPLRPAVGARVSIAQSHACAIRGGTV